MLSMKCIQQRNANNIGNMNGGNTAKPKSIETTISDPALQQNGHTIIQHVTEQHPLNKVLQSFTIKHTKGLRGRLLGTFHQSIWNNHIVLSMKCIKQRNTITTGNVNGRNIAKPKLTEQQLATPLDSRMDTPQRHKRHPLKMFSNHSC